MSVARSVVEARAHIGPKVAELAAQRANDTQIAAARSAAQKLADTAGPVAQQVAALDFWDAVVDGADSITFRLLYNTMRAAYEPALSAFAVALADEVGNADGYRAIVEAIADRDPAAATQAAATLLAPATSILMSAFGDMETLLREGESDAEDTDDI